MKRHPDLTQIKAETFCEHAHILVVDDEPLVIRVVTAHLRQGGFANISSTCDPRTAIYDITQVQPDLILLDLNMPQMSGMDLLKQIRKNQEFSDIVVLILSSANNADKYKSLNLGAVGFICKPVDAKQLVSHVKDALRLL